MELGAIPSELLSKIRMIFESSPRVRELRMRKELLMREGRHLEALGVSRSLDELFHRCVYEYVDEASRQVEHVDVSSMDIPLEDKERILSLLLVCFMCADMIESAVMDMDDVLHRHDPSLCMEMFNDLRELLSLSREKLKYLQENSGYMDGLVWSERCDDMYEMMQSKARSLIRKRKESGV